METKYYTAREAAELLHIHLNTLWKYLKSGDLKGIKMGRKETSRVWRISQKAIDDFMNREETK